MSEEVLLYYEQCFYFSGSILLEAVLLLKRVFFVLFLFLRMILLCSEQGVQGLKECR